MCVCVYQKENETKLKVAKFTTTPVYESNGSARFSVGMDFQNPNIQWITNILIWLEKLENKEHEGAQRETNKLWLNKNLWGNESALYRYLEETTKTSYINKTNLEIKPWEKKAVEEKKIKNVEKKEMYRRRSPLMSAALIRCSDGWKSMSNASFPKFTSIFLLLRRRRSGSPLETSRAEERF